MTKKAFVYAGIVGIVVLTLSIGSAFAGGPAAPDTDKPTVAAGQGVCDGEGPHGVGAGRRQGARDGQGYQHQGRRGEGQGLRNGEGAGERQGKGQGLRNGEGAGERQGLRHQAGTAQGGRHNAPEQGRGLKRGPQDGSGHGGRVNCDGSCPNCTHK